MKTLLAVCTGNTCRSPMAEAILADGLSKNPRLTGRVRVMSAGLMAQDGAPMTDSARRALEMLSITPGLHRARRLTAEMAENTDLILTMEAWHAGEIALRFPCAQGKVYTLKCFADGKSAPGRAGVDDIADPFGQPLEGYAAAAKEISCAVQKVLARLQNMNEWTLAAPGEQEGSF